MNVAKVPQTNNIEDIFGMYVRVANEGKQVRGGNCHHSRLRVSPFSLSKPRRDESERHLCTYTQTHRAKVSLAESNLLWSVLISAKVF